MIKSDHFITPAKSHSKPSQKEKNHKKKSLHQTHTFLHHTFCLTANNEYVDFYKLGFLKTIIHILKWHVLVHYGGVFLLCFIRFIVFANYIMNVHEGSYIYFFRLYDLQFFWPNIVVSLIYLFRYCLITSDLIRTEPQVTYPGLNRKDMLYFPQLIYLNKFWGTRII